MAGELRGAILEAIVFVAATEIQNKTGLTPIWGTKKVKWSSVVPDIVLLNHAQEEQALILITATDSSSDANRKFWRNFIELAESKVSKKTAFSVIDVTFEQTEKELYESVRNFIFDARVQPQSDNERRVFFELSSFCEKNMGSKATPHDCIAALAKLKGKNFDKYRSLVTSVSCQLEIAVQPKQSSIASLWSSISKLVVDRRKSSQVTVKNTNFTRGVCKSLLLSGAERQCVFANKALPRNSKGSELVEVGILRRTLQGFVLADQEIKKCVEEFGAESIEMVIANTPPERYQTYVSQLRGLANYISAVNSIIARKSQFENPAQLKQAILDTGASPGSTWTDSSAPPTYNWLLDCLIAVERDLLGGKMAEFYNDIERRSHIPKSVQRYHYPRAVRLVADLPENLLEALSNHFAERITSTTVAELESLKQNIKASVLQNVLECKLMTHGARPLQTRLMLALHGTKYEGKEPEPISCFLAKRDYFLTTEGFVFGKKIVICKSVTEMGRVHKVKEMKSKLLALKVYRGDKSEFRISKDRKIALFLDGTFDQCNVDDFLKCGADEVFFADQVDELRDWIVRDSGHA